MKSIEVGFNCTFISAPAHLHMTWVAKYPALFHILPPFNLSYGFFTCAGAKNLKKRLYNRQIDQWTDWQIYQLKTGLMLLHVPN